MARSSLAPALLVSFLGFVLASVAASAQQPSAELRLDRDHVLWSDSVVLHVEGVGCTGGFEDPVVTSDDFGNWAVDVDLRNCNAGPSAEFAYDIELDRLYPLEYEVRIQDAIRHIVSPPPPPLDVAILTVHEDASLRIDPVGVWTDEAPATVALSAPSRNSCGGFDGPYPEGDAIEFFFNDECPILPCCGPEVIRVEVEVGPLAPGTYELRVFDNDPSAPPELARSTVKVYDASRCVPGEETLCLNEERFQASGTWTNYEGGSGTAKAAPLEDRDDSGLFWFFRPENVELTLKVLDGCPVNGHWWVFLSSGSTVEFGLSVTDTSTGAEWTYQNALGETAPLIADIEAFPCE